MKDEQQAKRAVQWLVCHYEQINGMRGQVWHEPFELTGERFESKVAAWEACRRVFGTTKGWRVWTEDEFKATNGRWRLGSGTEQACSTSMA